ncbi:heavy metal translocating P-type ATPase [Lishizhenia sp.]|uniref:heavy metal translocating P-type ATPase n=1 Tax=Lishizhenia sp. TaxID=2497594 RepID=UPI00299DF997|nr:heavy metal translocating P-type ATPase metal-binding domain-containing protein [Lishizhenia sp.]MDX1444927.1 heavy metal translocating P-type ATPase metal-binding domain-containing protein [Lishizhenia sp.]
MNCYHCGDTCSTTIVIDEKNFCCNGCKTVYEILQLNALGDFYTINSTPGVKIDEDQVGYFDFLLLPEIQKKYLFFENEAIKKVVFHLPQIHCNSCIWLLENLPKIYDELEHAEVNFNAKKVQFTLTKSADIVAFAQFLQKLGYPPDFSTQEQSSKSNKKLLIKIGVAGFCFGNIMLFAFPEYLGMSEDESFRDLFLYLSFFLSIPVTFYSGWDYFKNSFIGLKNGVFNMDLPIVLGLITLFVRSTYELFVYTGQAYFDSLSGLIFFLLIGKWYQEKTYNHLNFDRDTLSFFPIAIQRKKGEEFETTNISDLQPGDIIQVRHKELIPADAIVMEGKPVIDYSFVTGESTPEYPQKKQAVYAGGKQMGDSLLLQVVKKTDQSYLTSLWNTQNSQLRPKDHKLTLLSNALSKYFTLFILLLSLGTATYWYFHDVNMIWRSVSAVLIVACPCALALSLPFTYGNAQRLLAKNSFFVRKMDLIDNLPDVTDIIFDKTGTLTDTSAIQLTLEGELSLEEANLLYTATSSSLHPLSLAINTYLKTNYKVQKFNISEFMEIPGQGLSFRKNNQFFKVGSSDFTALEHKKDYNGVFVTINGYYHCWFSVTHNYRPGIQESLAQLHKTYQLHLLTGDKNKDEALLKEKYGFSQLHFNQKPSDKLRYVQALEKAGKKVMMIGDGINDAAALSSSSFGIAVANKEHGFTPASDAILDGKKLHLLPQILKFALNSKRIVVSSFTLSFLYNAIGLFIAVQGIFAPVFAAILMPLSSISVVIFTTLSTSLSARRTLK